MRLTNIKTKTCKPKDKDYKVFDGAGLFLLVKKNGSKYWRFKYKHLGKEKVRAFGVYPEVSLQEARDKRETARKLLRAGTDPGRSAVDSGNTFKEISAEFLEHNAHRWKPSHKIHLEQIYERDVWPWIGDIPVKNLTAPDILHVCRRIVDRGALETATRTKQFIGQAIRYAIATGRAERDVTQDLKGALPSPKKGHFNAIVDPKELRKLLLDIDNYQGSLQVRTALLLQPLVFARPGNLVSMEWKEIDYSQQQWVIPSEKMKMRDRHIVPLSTQALNLLKEIQPLTGNKQFVFYSNQGKKRTGHISRETPGAIIRRMGYRDKHTAHGFRTTASTILHEKGFASDMIERQLAHAERNAVKAAYCHAEFLPERRRMMQAWSDYLDSLKANNVIVGDFGAKHSA